MESTTEETSDVVDKPTGDSDPMEVDNVPSQEPTSLDNVDSVVSNADESTADENVKEQEEPAASIDEADSASANNSSDTFSKRESGDSGDAADALATLASAALGQDQALKSVADFQETQSKVTNASPPSTVVHSIKMENSTWCDVGIVKGTSCVIKHFYHTDHTEEHTTINSDELPDYSTCQKIELLPGTAYKFRVCAINAYGRGEWSDVSAFKTCLPGYPGAPSSIKISKSIDGAHLSWEPPPANSGKIIEYSVCLAVRNATIQSQGDSKTISSVPGQLAFVRVYSGPQNQAIVHNTSLAAAHIDMTAKPAIIFRIAAKNDKGYGPATQVRWLQDSPSSSSKTTSSRKDKSQHNSTASKKYKMMNSH